MRAVAPSNPVAFHYLAHLERHPAHTLLVHPTESMLSLLPSLAPPNRAWRGQSVVSYTPASGPTVEWLRALFDFLRNAEATSGPGCISHLHDWPVVPAFLNAAPVLLSPSVALASAITFHSGPALIQETLSRQASATGEAEAVASGAAGGAAGATAVDVAASITADHVLFDVLGRLGVPVMDSRFDVSGVGLKANLPTGVTLLEILHAGTFAAKRSVTWDSATPSDIEYLLRRWEADLSSISEGQLTLLRQLPVFAVERATPGSSFIPIHDLARPRELPETSFGGTLEGTFLRKTSVAPSLYRALGIQALSAVEYYRDYVFPTFPDLSDAERLLHMDQVQELVSTLPPLSWTHPQLLRRPSARSPHMGAVISAMGPCQLVRESLRAPFFTLPSAVPISSREPPCTFLHLTLRCAALLSCCPQFPRLCREDPSFSAVVGKVRFVRLPGRAAMACAEELYDPDNTFFRTFRSEMLLPGAMRVWEPLLRQAGMRTVVNHASFLGAARDVETSGDQTKAKLLVDYLVEHARLFEAPDGMTESDDMTTTRVTPAVREFFRTVGQLRLGVPQATPLHLKDFDGLYPLSSMGVSMRYLKSGISSTSFDTYLIWSQRPVLATARYLNARLRELLGIALPTLDEVLGHLRFLSALPGQVLSRLNELHDFTRGLSEVYSFLAQQPLEQVGTALQGRRCLLLDTFVTNEPTFVAADDVFFHLSTDNVPPFAYHSTSLHRTLPLVGRDLLRRLGVSETPTVQHVTKWLETIHAQHDGVPLPRAIFSTVVALLDLARRHCHPYVALRCAAASRPARHYLRRASRNRLSTLASRLPLGVAARRCWCTWSTDCVCNS